MPGVGLTELVVILIIVLVIFGAGRLPQIGSGLGKAIRGFKDAIEGKDAIDVTPKKGAKGEVEDKEAGEKGKK
ncbi:MAG: twin-arginine translocase TatA/TatE family subunit [candidate division NC10 bacterium]|nr:twin-arginine translocase TatA/TatE family subunit [candidate division NC10 bacterium]